MNNSYFKFVFSDMPLSVAVALSFKASDMNRTTYKLMWEAIESKFGTSRSNLISFYHITKSEFDMNYLKLFIA